MTQLNTPQDPQSEALRLAAWLNEGAWHQMKLGDVEAAGRELRRLHAENSDLRAQLEAVGAGGVESLRSAAQVQPAGECDTPNYCRSVVRCTAMDEKRSQSQSTAQAPDAVRMDFLVKKANLVRYDGGWKSSFDVSVNGQLNGIFHQGFRAAVDAAIAAQQGGTNG